MSSWPDHHCPGCGATRKAFPRYPWHFCNDCKELTEDFGGRRLVFGNESMSGGLVWGFAGKEARYASLRVLCLILKRPVLVTEARFGGVVVQPFVTRPQDALDLRKPGADLAALRRVDSKAPTSPHARGLGFGR